MTDKTTKKPEKKSSKIDEKNSKIDEKASKIDVRSERFIRVVGRRAQHVIDKLFSMGNILKNPQNYRYNLEQIDLIFQPIEDLVAKLKEGFIETITKSDVRDTYKIDLSQKIQKEDEENVKK